MKNYWIILLVFVSISNAKGQSKTAFDASTGEYGVLLDNMEKDMMKDVERSTRMLGGRTRNIFVPWIRDNTHVTKAMKYLVPDLSSFLEYYMENQTSEGIYFDYVVRLGYGGSGSRKKIFDQRFWKEFPEDSVEMHRLPVEADLEYLIVEAAYAVWQANGDTAFLRKWLPTLVKGMRYSMTDPLRWSKKYELVKRGYTLDTWDFMQLPASRDEFKKQGGNIQKAIFNIDEHTPMGIMHGDNSGMYAACIQLSAMFTAIGDKANAGLWSEHGSGIRNRTNTLCWNGKFYAHFVQDDPLPPYLKMDQRNTLSLSNPYDINRGLPSEQMAESIIEQYQKLKTSNADSSFAEWYGVYPAVKPSFADYKPGSYMNGGVNTIVAGELAKAAFEHGYEKYGVDILQRIIALTSKYNGNLPVSYTPSGVVDQGIPDSWGQAAVYSALIEGLAGIVDKSARFTNVEISPRWLAAGKDSANVTVIYPASHATIGYTYTHQAAQHILSINIHGKIDKGTIRFLLPDGISHATILVNERSQPAVMEKLNKSFYAVVKGVSGIDLQLKANY